MKAPSSESAIDKSDYIKAVDATKFLDLIFSAKRAGDYYMFEYDPSEDSLDKPVETFVPEVTPGASDFNKLDPTQVSLSCIEVYLSKKKTNQIENTNICSFVSSGQLYLLIHIAFLIFSGLRVA